MAWVQQDPAYNDPVDPAYGRALVALEETTFGPTTDTLELALRLVAYHAWGHAVPSGFDAELLDEARFTAEMTSPGIPVRYVDDPDPFVHAMVLLAVAADPAFIPPTAGDVDGDLVADAGDAFPYDPFFTADMDGDGIPDGIDEDLDGDGTPNDVDGPSGLFADDPTEWADADGDGTGDNADDMDDSDSLSDLAEVALGTDPTNPADRRNKRSFEVREPPVMTTPRGNSG
jgi:hypothetical protein